MNKFIRVMGYGLWVMGYVLLITHHSSLITPTHAQSLSATATASSSLLEKINAIKRDVASKAAQLKESVSKNLQNKAYFGTVLSVDGSKINLQGVEKTKTVTTDEYTEFISKVKGQKSKPTLKDIKPEDFIVALGDVDDKNELKAKRIIKETKLASDSAKLVWGQIQSASSPNITVKDKEGEKVTIRTLGSTMFYLGNEESSILDAKSGQSLVAKGTMPDDQTLSAKFVYFIPTAQFVKPQKKPEATISATPSVSPKKR